MPLTSRGLTSKAARNVIFQAYRSSWISPTSSNSRQIHGGPNLIKTPKDPTSRHSVTSVAASPTASEEVEKCFNKLDLSFTNTKEAFKVAPTVQRIRRFGVKSILDYSVESDISQQEAEEKAVEGFVGKDQAAETFEGIGDNQTFEKTHKQFSVHKEFGDRRLDVVSARTYFYAGERECDKNVDIFCQSIDSVVEATGREGFAAIKLTALGRPQLLLKLSETIVQTRNFFKALTGSPWENFIMSKISEEDFLRKLKEFGIKVDSKQVKEWFKTVDFDDDGFVDFHDWGNLLDKNKEVASMFKVLNIRTGKVQPLIENLSKSEEQEFANMMQRLVHVADHAAHKGVRIMIDAEQTYFQPAISRLTVAMMRKYNKNGGQILNTYQAYLRSALTNIEIDMSLAKRENFHFGCKLVRGAYMDQERKRAQAVGYEDPINPNFEATTQMYYRCLERIIQERAARGPGQVSVMVASHNEDGIRHAVKLMKENNIAPSERVICFAQLFGMCDQVSFSLGQAGYSVYKYVPYGPVEDVLPYLSRRALENGGMLGKAQKERDLLWSEIKRRISSGQLIYKVPQVA
ncbi:hypothetical protein FO519_003011 [Halicephalobus sp. NKZ332]|nr:hypothetical protein FO519_003011 [Halicephalobus sp. NKZ332]